MSNRWFGWVTLEIVFMIVEAIALVSAGLLLPDRRSNRLVINGSLG